MWSLGVLYDLTVGDSLYAGGEADGIPRLWPNQAQVSSRRGEGALSL